MVIFMLEEGFISPVQGVDEVKVRVYSKYTEKSLTNLKIYTKIKFANEEFRTIEDKELNKHSEIKRFVKHYEEVLSHIQVTDETKRIIKILDGINANMYLESEEVFLKNRLEFVVDDTKRRDQIMNDINSHTFYVLDANQIAMSVFNLPSSRGITSDNANEILNKNISRKLREKINFLKSINASRDEEFNTLEIKRVNGKSIASSSISINSLESTNLKVGRIGRIIVAAVPGLCIRRKKDIIFNEENDSTDALVFIPIGSYAKRYLIDAFDLKYFGFCKGCLMGITDIENVKSLF